MADNQSLRASGLAQFFVHYFSLIYISNLSNNLEPHVKPFADDTLIFLVTSDPTNTSQKLNKDFANAGLWASKWKLSFDPDPSTQAQEIMFSRDISKVYYPLLLFNDSTLQ